MVDSDEEISEDEKDENTLPIMYRFYLAQMNLTDLMKKHFEQLTSEARKSFSSIHSNIKNLE